MVRNLRSRSRLLSVDIGYQECCNLTAKNKLTYDPRFKEKITDQIFCQFKAPDHVQKEQPDFKEVKTAFDKNYKEVSLYTN